MLTETEAAWDEASWLWRRFGPNDGPEAAKLHGNRRRREARAQLFLHVHPPSPPFSDRSYNSSRSDLGDSYSAVSTPLLYSFFFRWGWRERVGDMLVEWWSLYFSVASAHQQPVCPQQFPSDANRTIWFSHKRDKPWSDKMLGGRHSPDGRTQFSSIATQLFVITHLTGLTKTFSSPFSDRTAWRVSNW